MNLDELEQLARKATPGPWSVRIGSHMRDGTPRVDGIYGPERTEDYGLGPERVAQRIVETDSGYYEPKWNDAAFIAAANPETVLALVRVARTADAVMKLLDDKVPIWAGIVSNAAAELCDALDALKEPKCPA